MTLVREMFVGLWCVAPFGFVTTATAVSVPARSSSGASWEAQVDRLVEHLMKTYDIPGMALGVVQDGEVVFAKGFGVKSRATQEPVTTRSLFHMASVSKPFVATAMVRLAEEGQLDLDASPGEYLDYFELDDARAESITLRHMLTHSSGMPDVLDYHWDKPEDDDECLERYVRSLSDRQLLFEPNTRRRYSNMAFEVLGDVIAKVSEQSFEDYVRNEILRPLGMKDSSFFRPETDPTLRTTGHVTRLRSVVSEVYPYHRAHAPSSTLHSNVDDMLRWILANLRGGTLDDYEFLPKYRLEEMWTLEEELPGSEVGLSWFLDDSHGTRLVSHGGADTGFRSYLGLLPDRNAGFVMMSNSGSASRAQGWVQDALIELLQDRPIQRVNVRAPVDLEVGRVLAEHGIERAVSHYQLLRSNPATFAGNERHLLALAGQAKELGRNEDALALLELNREDYPDSADTFYFLGEWHRENGERASAISFYEEALEKSPAHEGSLQALKLLRE